MAAFNKVLVFLVCVLAAPLAGLVEAEDGWRWGRATFYGIWWSIHTGSCGYGNIDYWQGTGWDVAAIPDSHYEYNWSCGKCYEVKCEPMDFKDNYGNHLKRSDACYDPWKVVTVTIVDSCRCNYPSNAYSNKRWCCGDMDHFDLSYHTFDKLAPRHYGVIGLKYRPVACPSSYLENRHHLGRKLKDAGENKEGPQIVVLDERYERPEGVEGALPAVNSNVHVGSLPSNYLDELNGKEDANAETDEPLQGKDTAVSEEEAETDGSLPENNATEGDAVVQSIASRNPRQDQTSAEPLQKLDALLKQAKDMTSAMMSKA